MDLIMKVFFRYFICVYASILFTRVDSYSVLIDMNTNSSLISCSNSSLIRIENITVQTGECDTKPCMLNVIDYNTIRMRCNNLNSCVLNLSLTSKCISEYGYFALSYTCKDVDTFEEQLCTFQDSFCNWSQLIGVDDFNWTRNTGPTTTLKTGPNVDHTFNNKTGYYIYIEADHSVNQPSRTARLTSMKIESDRPKCLTFWYHMYGANIKQLNVYRNTTAKNSSLIWSRTGNQSDFWKPARIDLQQLNTSFYIVIEGVCGNRYEKYGDIAVDDIAVLNTPCNGEYHYTTQTCLNIDSKLEITDCPSMKFGDDFSISVDTKPSGQEIQRCQSIIEWYRNDINKTCNSIDSNFCHIEWLNNTETMRSCFHINKKIRIQYSCQEVPDSAAQSPNTTNTTGIIVGVVFSFGFIIGLVTFLLYFMRRSKSYCKKSESNDNKMLSNNYTGHQSIALPALHSPMANTDGYAKIQINSDNYQHAYSTLKTSINKRENNHAKLDQLKNSSDNKAGNTLHASDATSHHYIYFDETETGSTQTSINGPDVNMMNHKIHKSSDYAVVDQNDDHISGNDRLITPATSPSGNYAILDPNETGFFKSNGNNETTTEYDLAKPVNDNECVSDLQNPYLLSAEGTYDSTGRLRHKKSETNIYSHAVENVYDTSSHEREIVENEDAYDHFNGDETDDNYIITKKE